MLHAKYLPFLRDIKFLSLTLAIFILVIATFSVYSISEKIITAQLTPEIEKKSIALCQTTLSPINKALQLGIKIQALRGVPDLFDDIMRDNKEVQYIALTDTRGIVLYQRGANTPYIQQHLQEHQKMADNLSYNFGTFQNTKMPLIINNDTMGFLHLGINFDVISNNLRDISYDTLVVLIISLLVTFEILLFSLGYRVSHPISIAKEVFSSVNKGDYSRGIQIKSRDEIGNFAKSYNMLIKKINYLFKDTKDKIKIFEILCQDKTKIDSIKNKFSEIEENNKFNIKFLQHTTPPRIGYIRLPLFAFVFAESLSISFLPIFSNFLYEPFWGLPRTFVIALPITFFMMVYAISQPFSGIWANIANKRTLFVIGALISAIGLAGAGFSETIWQFIGWRMFTAIGYGTVLISSQSYIIDNTPVEQRSQGMAIYISGFYSATVCGSAIGSILADGIGYKLTFVLSSFLAVLSAILVLIYIKDRRLAPRTGIQKVNLSAIRLIFKNKQFLSLLFCVSIPSKIILASVLFYLTPIYLSNIGTKQSEIGRVIMVYGFIMLILSPIAARFADQLKKPKLFIFLGSLLSGISVLPCLLVSGFWGLVITVFLLGLGHSLSMTSQVAIVPTLLEEESKIIGVPTVISIYRFFDFQGFVIGPLIAGLLIARFNFETTIAIQGVGIIFLSLLFWQMVGSSPSSGVKAAQT